MNDIIIDMKSYAKSHPGGLFLLDKNVGRDIGKYFDGGYQMENNCGLRPWNHSYQARLIIDKLAIGYLIGKSHSFSAKITSFHPINKHTAVFIFRAPRKIPGVRTFYKDFSCHGRHFMLTKGDGEGD